MAAAAGSGGAQNQGAAGMMTPMLFLLGIMMLLMFNPGLRDTKLHLPKVLDGGLLI